MQVSDSELLYTLALQRAKNLGAIKAKKLLSKCNSAEAIFNEKSHNLLKIHDIGSVTIRDLSNKNLLISAEKELEFIKKNKINYHYYIDDSYPFKLKHCVDSPLLLFSRGNINFKNHQKVISIVGTRNITKSGISFCEKLIEDLKYFDPIIVSGLAYGTDIVAHKTAIKHNLQTVACLAHGLNQIYPKTHFTYAKDIEENGGFFTDFWSDTEPLRENFLKRNRIIAGLSEATIIIESADKGGSLVTADYAYQYNREVFAIPGKPTDKFSVGCNKLIKTQKAQLLESAADLIYMLNWEIDEQKPKVIQKKMFVNLSDDEQKIANYLQENSKELLDVISLENDFTIQKTASILFNLEMNGLVRPLPGKLFELI